MRHWIVVASADHVARGVAGGFVQACHGKAGPLERMRPGDMVFCYAPVATFGGRDTLQAFVAMGIVADRPFYEVTCGDRRPHRRNVEWTATSVASIRPLLCRLALTAGKRHWGAAFRYGFLEIGARDAALIGVALRLAGARSVFAETPRRAA